MRSTLEIMYESDTDFAPCVHQLSFRRSCRSQPFMESTWCCPLAFSAGRCQYDSPRSYTHLSSIFLQTQTRCRGFSSGLGIIPFKSHATLVECTVCPPQTPKHSRVYRSITISRCNHLPPNSASETKSTPQTGWGSWSRGGICRRFAD